MRSAVTKAAIGCVHSIQTAVAQTLMSMDHVSFRLTPVAGYLDFKTIFEEQIEHDENVRLALQFSNTRRCASFSAISQLKTIVCINCGGTIHLPDLLPVLERDVQIIVFDSNRPIYHTSINSSEQVCRHLNCSDLASCTQRSSHN